MVDEKRTFTTVDLNNDFDASAKRLEELKAGREEWQIPLNDEYWKALNKHRQAHNKG